MLRPAHIDASWIGQILPWDLYTDSGVLIAAAGMPIDDEAQYLRLVARPLYRDVAYPARSPRIGVGAADRLASLAREAEALMAPPYGISFQDQLTTLVRALLILYRDDPDRCLGYGRLVPLARPVLRHAMQVMMIAVLLGEEQDLGETGLEQLACAALTMNFDAFDLHDRLYSQSGRLGEADRQSIRAHPAAAAQALSATGVDAAGWLAAVAQHHECMDGSGYPEGLQGEAIAMPARILHVADVYCSKLASRHYRPAKTPGVAMQELFGIDRHRLDEQLASLLMRRLGLYPPGTLVRLENGESACIARRGQGGSVRRAISFLDAEGRLLEPPRGRDLATHTIRGLLSPDPAWPAVEWERIWEE